MSVKEAITAGTRLKIESTVFDSTEENKRNIVHKLLQLFSEIHVEDNDQRIDLHTILDRLRDLISYD